MNDYKLKITHLCVGQGLSVLIKLTYFDEDGDYKMFLGLLDCGSTKGGERAYGRALDTIKGDIVLNKGVLNYVHISHFDEDHYNLLKSLGKKYEQDSNTKIIIEKMVCGCTENKKIEKIKNKFKNFFSIQEDNIYIRKREFGCMLKYDIYMLPKNYIYNELCVNIGLGGNLYFRIIPIMYHAHLAPEGLLDLLKINLKDGSVLINTGSSIVMVTIVDEEYGPLFSYIFTGDATVETMKIMRYVSDLKFWYECKLLQIAHHGAIRHVADEEGDESFASNFETLEWFLDMVKPNAAVVSAMCKNQKGWAHPHNDTMNFYSEKIQMECEQGVVTAFEYIDGKIMVRQIQTTKALYGTFKLDGVEDRTLYKDCHSDKFSFCNILTWTDSKEPSEMRICEQELE